MAAPDWTHHPATSVVADRALHAGLTVEVWRGNLLRIYQEQKYDICSFPQETDNYFHSFGGDTDDWEHLSELSAVAVPIRPAYPDGWRDIGVSIEGKVSAIGVDVKVRFYLRTIWDSSPSFDVDDGFPDESAWCRLDFDLATWERKSGTITPVDVGVAPAPANPMGPTRRYPRCLLVALAESDTAWSSISLRGLRICEVVTVS